MRCEDIKVLSNEKIASNVYLLTLPFPHNPPQPGQFVMLKQEHATTLLPRPISVCDVVDGTLVLLYQVVGKGTHQLSALVPGDSINMTGPVGHGFPVDEAQGKIALVGGGVGIAPLVYTGRKLKEKGIHVGSYLGFRDEAYLADKFAGFSNSLYVSTESGRDGNKGLVTKGLDPNQYDAVYCCGPTPMMEAVIKMCEACDVPVYVSLETKMACGIGACRVCTCTTTEGKNLRTCMDGPVFLGKELNFHA